MPFLQPFTHKDKPGIYKRNRMYKRSFYSEGTVLDLRRRRRSLGFKKKKDDSMRGQEAKTRIFCCQSWKEPFAKSHFPSSFSELLRNKLNRLHLSSSRSTEVAQTDFFGFGIANMKTVVKRVAAGYSGRHFVYKKNKLHFTPSITVMCFFSISSCVLVVCKKIRAILLKAGRTSWKEWF